MSRGPVLLRRTPAALANGALAAGQELVWLAAHALTYPVGLLAEQVAMEDSRYRIDTLSPLTRGLILADIGAAGRPVVLVHGIGDNRSAFTILRRTLRRRGFGRIVTVNYSPLTSDVRKAAADLARHVERVCQQSGYEQVFVVGHSLGGIIARYYVQRLAGDARVSTLITLGSPHAGSPLARMAPPLLVGRQLRPNSELMRELAGPARCSTRFVAIYSDRDAVVPHHSARLEHPDLLVTALRVRGVGHLSLLANSSVAHAIAAALVSEAGLLADGLSDRQEPESADDSPIPAV
ncbi:MAG: alpha/beta fold hydrolase [Jatrophihabitantaceae bacterium]